jgi:BASS family bile acid:Na+ symporter
VRVAFTVAVAIAIALTVLSMGMVLRVEQLAATLRRASLLGTVCLANLVVVPGLAWLVAAALPLEPEHQVGVVLVAVGAGGAAGLKAVQLSRRGDEALAIGLVVLLELLNLISVPLWAGRLVEGGTIRPADVLTNLVGLVLLPLGLGLFVGSKMPRLAGFVVPWAIRLATVFLVVALVAGVASARQVASLVTSWVPVAALATCLVALAIGYAVSWRDRQARVTASIVTGTRFSALGLLVVATALPDDPGYQSAAVLAALVNLVVSITVALLVSRTSATQPRAGGGPSRVSGVGR